MRLTKLSLRNYRNIGELELDLHPRLTVLVGDNGEGKTNILESIHLLSFPRSFRGNKDNQLPQWEESFCRIEGAVAADNDEDEVTDLVFFYDGRKKLMVNGGPARGVEYVGKFLSVLFAPEDISLLTGSPSGRRNFLDAHLSQTSTSYYQHLLHYNAVIKQRNKLLANPRTTEVELEYWNSQQVLHGSELWVGRLDLVAQLNEVLIEHNLELVYSPSLPLNGDTLLSDFQEKQAALSEREKYAGHSLVGPHRDDWQLYSTLPERRDLSDFGSRGQQRMGVIELKRAELQLLHDKTGERAVLLLDDVLSELDAENQQRLVTSLVDQQTVITTASLSDIPEELLGEAKVLKVKEGKLIASE